MTIYYAEGHMGMPQDRAKENELFLKAGELGCAYAYCNLGSAYIWRTMKMMALLIFYQQSFEIS